VKILYLCHRFPFPPRRGGKIRPFNMIRHLAERHEVHVVSLVRSAAEAAEGEGIRAHCASHAMAPVRDPVQWLRMIARVPTLTPSSFGFFHSARMARLVRNAVTEREFDLVFVHCSSVARYVENVTSVPKILDFGDMDSQKWLEYARYKPFPLSLAFGLEARKLEREEKRLARRFDFCTATTHAEWETLARFAPDTPTDWFPNGVDTDYFAPADERYDRDTITFVGRMDYYPNQESMFRFCATVLPLLRARRPGLKLQIVGADPSPAVRRLGDLPGVTVTGSVPDVRPYLRSSALMVAPLAIARGTQNKILEAMAMGVPVVTSRVAAGGVDAEDPEHFLAASTPDEYATAIERIAADPTLRRRLAIAGRERMLSHHAWDRSMRRLDDIVDRCVANFARQGALQTA
jgi:sugar transferase (PEP-CTERM/EpsH1 system associated)